MEILIENIKKLNNEINNIPNLNLNEGGCGWFCYLMYHWVKANYKLNLTIHKTKGGNHYFCSLSHNGIRYYFDGEIISPQVIPSWWGYYGTDLDIDELKVLLGTVNWNDKYKTKNNVLLNNLIINTI